MLLALVVQRIGRKIADLAIEVRFLTSAQKLKLSRLGRILVFVYC